ncbi:STAS domain-containing protein [Streptomyces beijiangensis]|uniref:STAS domain-containing protein n=1 Tax=Streptomyces beijiangensis TaxID=163361 RepID=A0A939FDN9_9ACTN|nr:STAS domain-containing protein [Streptomyces beijiangensis]MBO0515487.1 STAS domain-containing protein [Streptomyces beijiangensis]
MPILLHPVDLPHCTVVPLPVEIDISNLPSLYAETGRVISDREGRLDVLVLDLTRTEFIDSRGAALIPAVQERAREAGARTRVAVGSDQVALVLQLMRIRRDVPVYHDLADALMPAHHA